MQNVLCQMFHVKCGMRKCDMQNVAVRMWCAKCDLQNVVVGMWRAKCDMQNATWLNMQNVTCKLRHESCDMRMWYEKCNLRNIQCDSCSIGDDCARGTLLVNLYYLVIWKIHNFDHLHVYRQYKTPAVYLLINRWCYHAIHGAFICSTICVLAAVWRGFLTDYYQYAGQFLYECIT